MGQARVNDRKQLGYHHEKNNFERAIGGSSRGFCLGKLSPLRTPQGPVPPSQTRISRVDDSGTTRVPSPFFWTFG